MTPDPVDVSAEPDWNVLAPYAGRWVALVRGRVAGVGWTGEEARRAAKRSRPKEEPEVIFVPAVEDPREIPNESDETG